MSPTAALAAALLLAMPAAAAPTAPPASPAVVWTPDGPMDGGDPPNPRFASVRIVHRGAQVRGLPVASRQIEPHWHWQGRDWTLSDYMAAYGVSGVMALKDGQVILERYGAGRAPTDRWFSQSVAKSVVSLLYGAAVREGRIRLSDPIIRFLPELRGTAWEPVTVRHLLTMSSGIGWREAYDFAGGGSDLERYYLVDDPLRDLLAKLPRAHEPGTVFHYSTGETHLAGMVLARAVGMPLADYLSREIWGPAGMERDGAWRLDRQGRELAGCCLAMTLADYARLGQFVLEGGRVQGRQIVDPAFLAQATRRQIDNGRPAPAGYGYLWWIGPRAFEASGIHGQSILIYPQDRLVIAINSHWARPDAPEDFAAQGALQAAIREAVRAP